MVIVGTAKRWLKRLGYPLFGLMTFALALHYTFPYQRLGDRIITSALGDHFEISHFSVGAGWFPGQLVAKDINLKSRPEREGDKPVEITINKIRLSLGLLALLTGTYEVAIKAELGEGIVKGKVRHNKDMTSFSFATEELSLATVPGITSVTAGLPIDGGLNAQLDVNLPKGKWSESSGTMEMSCDACTLGDGKTPARPTGQANAFTDGGLTLPKFSLGKMGGKIQIMKGLAVFEEFEAKSKDGELSLEGDIQFKDPFNSSVVGTLCLKYRFSDELRNREPKVADMEPLLSPGRRPDGFIGNKITGPIGQLRYLVSRNCTVPVRGDKGPAVAGKDRRGGPGKRPAPGRPSGEQPPRPALVAEPGGEFQPLPGAPVNDLPPPELSGGSASVPPDPQPDPAQMHEPPAHEEPPAPEPREIDVEPAPQPQEPAPEVAPEPEVPPGQSVDPPEE